MFNKIYIVPKLNADNDVVHQACDVVRFVATKTGKLILSQQHEIDHTTLVVAVGGDGTMLEAMRIASARNALTTGVNLGKVGFLTDFSNSNELVQELLELFTNPTSFPVEERMSLVVVPDNCHNCSPKPVFNELVVSGVYNDTIVRYHLRINNVDAGYHKANGVIVGTPTGSTAYTLSNGGGLMYPSMSVMQIVPVAPLSMSSRPIIVPGDAIVEIVPEIDGEWALRGDGNILCKFETSVPIRITQNKTKAHIIHTKDWNFFDMLTSKLHWRNHG